MSTETPKEAALREVKEELFRNAVEYEKQKIRANDGVKWWHSMLPFTVKITINRRK